MRPADAALSHACLPSSSAAIRHPTKRRAFSLIEAAVVLGVVGLVIGGIWVAAGAVTYNQKRNDFIQAIGSTAANLQALFKNMNLPTQISISSNPILLEQVTPKNQLINGVWKNPWGSEPIIIAIDNTEISFGIEISDNSICADISPRIYAAFKKDLIINSDRYIYSDDGFKLDTPEDAAMNCDGLIQFSFNR